MVKRKSSFASFYSHAEGFKESAATVACGLANENAVNFSNLNDCSAANFSKLLQWTKQILTRSFDFFQHSQIQQNPGGRFPGPRPRLPARPFAETRPPALKVQGRRDCRRPGADVMKLVPSPPIRLTE